MKKLNGPFIIVIYLFIFASKDIIKKGKRQPIYGRKYLQITYTTRFVYGIYKGLLQINNKKIKDKLPIFSKWAKM